MEEVFFDGFDGSALDRSKWPILYGGSTYWNGAFRWDNGQVSVSGGELTIGLDRGADGVWDVGGLSTTPSSWAPGFSFTYGHVEIRAKVSEEVVGAGPCFLLWPASNDHWPPEVDILEVPYGDGMFTNHWQGEDGGDRYESHGFELDYSQWHTYALDWTPYRLTLYVDGEALYTTTEHIPQEAMTLGLQGHVGAASDAWYGGSPNGSGVSGVDISVDYVSVSRWTDGYPAAPAPAPSASAAEIEVGSGPDALVLRISQDAYLGDAQYVIRVDGQPVGGTLTACALHGGGQSDTVTVRGDWGPGEHGVEVQFLNDEWGGTADTDRNLHVDGASYNGEAVPGASLDLVSSGTQGFSFGEAEAPASGDATVLNVLVRGQSNAIFLMEGGGWAGAAHLQREIERQLGFDGATQKVNLIFDRWEGDGAATAFGGTALIGDWLTAKNGDWTQGWETGGLEQMLLNQVGQLSAGEKAQPGAVVWLHSEYDSRDGDLTPEEWMSAVRHDAGLVREAWGKTAAELPYLFVSAHPYWGADQGHQAIRQGMERLAADASFNADIAARALDMNIDRDDYDGDAATREYGGSHLSDSDVLIVADRVAKVVAEQFAGHATPGSPVALAGGDIDDHGPQVVAAEIVGANQLLLAVAHDGSAEGFQALDADAAGGLGWSVRGGSEVLVATGAQVVDGTHLLVTFDGAVPAGGKLFYGYGHGRLGGADGTGQGNAVYDDHGMPTWVSAEGLQVGGSAAAPGPAPEPAPGPAPEPTPEPEPTPGPEPAPIDWAAIAKAVQDFYDANGWWASWEQIQDMQAQPTPPASDPATLTVGSGPDSLVLRISQDAYQGDAEYAVLVDGQQVGGTLTARALHGSGLSDAVTVKGDWAAGLHGVEVRFLNDAWGGTADTDRNLYVTSATYNGKAVDGAAMDLMSSGARGFGFVEATPLAPDADGIVHGTSGADVFVFGGHTAGTSIEGFEAGKDLLVFEGVDPGTVSLYASNDWAHGWDAWGQRIDYGAEGESVFLRWSWAVDRGDLAFA